MRISALLDLLCRQQCLLERGEKLSRDAIRKHMAGNLCRCTGYENIVNASRKSNGREYS